MYKYSCLNPIAQVGLDNFTTDYRQTDDINDADAILVRSAKMHDMDFSDKLLAVARAGAGTNNIPVEECGNKGIVVFNTPGANANAVKELVFAGMLLASRDIIGGIQWCKDNANDADIAKTAEKAKKHIVDPHQNPGVMPGLFFFPGSAALLRLAEDIQEVPGSLCWCGKKATMNTRVDSKGNVIKQGAQVLIDNQDEIRYVGLCYQHWREGKSHA